MKLTKKDVKLLVDNPHRLGHILGYHDLTELHGHWIKYIWYPKDYFLNNCNWKETLDYFNSLGPTLDIEKDNLITREYLTKEMFLNLLDSKRSLQAHRGGYKTTGIIVVGCLLRLLLEPNITIGIVRKNFTLSSETLKNIALLSEKEQYQAMFYAIYHIYPKIIKNSEKTLTFNFKQTVTPQGNVNAYGLHGKITGEHLDFILLDDFITIDDKISRAEREKTIVRLEEIRVNILNPGKQIAFIGTPWHRDDAWNFCPNPLKFDVYITKIFSEDTILEKRKGTTNVTWNANYELKHVAHEDCLFQNPQFANWEFHYYNGLGFLDKKFFGTDTNALGFFAKKKNGRFQAIGWVFHENIKEKINFIYEKWKEYRIGTIYTEDNDDKGFTADLLRGRNVFVETYHENMNKHVKIKTYGYENGFWELIDWDSKTDPEFLNQIMDYVEGSEPDDSPDLLGCAGRQLIGSTGKSIYTERWKKMR